MCCSFHAAIHPALVSDATIVVTSSAGCWIVTFAIVVTGAGHPAGAATGGGGGGGSRWTVMIGNESWTTFDVPGETFSSTIVAARAS
jgi:hypothetical protein